MKKKEGKKGRKKKKDREKVFLLLRFPDDQFDPELAVTIGVDFKVKVF